MPKLSNADQSAIDGILMNGQATSVPSAAPADASGRIESAARVLRLLDRLPEAEVPVGLAERTVQRIQKAAYTGDTLPTQPIVTPEPLA